MACAPRPAGQVKHIWEALGVAHPISQAPCRGPRHCLSEAPFLQSADLRLEEDQESSPVADFGSSEHLGSWRDEQAQAGAGVSGAQGVGGWRGCGSARPAPITDLHFPGKPAWPWAPGAWRATSTGSGSNCASSCRGGPRCRRSGRRVTSKVGGAGGTGCGRGSGRRGAGFVAEMGGARGGDGQGSRCRRGAQTRLFPQTRCSAARWPSCVSARRAPSRASCSSASAPWRPGVRVREWKTLQDPWERRGNGTPGRRMGNRTPRRWWCGGGTGPHQDPWEGWGSRALPQA